MNDRPAPLRTELAGIALQNPVMLAAGTAAYGDELAGVMDIDALGGIVTKAVSLEPRAGARAPRVAEFPGGMINAVGLANPGVERVRTTHLPWLASHLQRARVLVNVVGYAVEDFAGVIARLGDVPGVDGFELNVAAQRAGGRSRVRGGPRCLSSSSGRPATPPTSWSSGSCRHSS
jgi:dihydroorotate dehydrogenase (NAD+) catalytic subunit